MTKKSKRPKQTEFFEKPIESHGGKPLKGKRKVARPLDSRRHLHMVLKSSKAKNQYSMNGPKFRLEIEEIVRETAKESGIKINRFSNVGNHLHILLRFHNRAMFKRFLRIITGLIARLVTGAKKGRPFAGGKFWDHIAFTRVVNWGRDLKEMLTYIFKNDLERFGGKVERAYFDAKRADEREQKTRQYG